MGDRIAPASGDVANVVNFFFPATAPNAVMTVDVQRAGETRRIVLYAEAAKLTSYEALAGRMLVYALETIRIIFFLIAALIVVRRADRPAARALATFLIAFAFGTLGRWPWYPAAIAAALTVARAMALCFGLTQAVHFATIFPRRSSSGPRDIGFVINRALVFGAISALVVAAFSLLEFVLGRYVTSLGHVQSAILEALLALGIGVSLGRFHTRVGAVVDTVFFQDRHRAEAALHRLAHDAAYVDDPHVLADRIVTAVDRHGNASGTALYLHAGTCYLPFLATLVGTDAIQRNDAAIVRMRAVGDEIDLEDLVREVGPTACAGTIAFPMIVRGELLGILACGSKRDHEAYAPDERAMLSELARAAGSAFDTIQTLALRRAVDRAIAGDVDLDDLRRARLSFDGGLPS